MKKVQLSLTAEEAVAVARLTGNSTCVAVGPHRVTANTAFDRAVVSVWRKLLALGVNASAYDPESGRKVSVWWAGPRVTPVVHGGMDDGERSLAEKKVSEIDRLFAEVVRLQGVNSV